MVNPILWTNARGWNDVFGVRREFDNLLDRFFSTNGGQQQLYTGWAPAVTVRETNEAIEVRAELPGMTEADVNVTVQGGVLTISGEKKAEMDQAGEDVAIHLDERRFGRFERSFTLPRTVVSDDIQAHFANGLLSITLPKSAEAKPRRIQVRTEAGKASRIEAGAGK